MKIVGLGACAFIVLASFGVVLWKSLSAETESDDVVQYSQDPRDVIEASVAKFEDLSSYSVLISSKTAEDEILTKTEEYYATIDVRLPSWTHQTVYNHNFEAVTNGESAWIEDCAGAAQDCEWVKWPYSQYIVSNPGDPFEETYGVVALDMSSDVEILVVTEGDRPLANLRGTVNPVRVGIENFVRQQAAAQGAMTIGQHCGQEIPDAPTPVPGSCPDLGAVLQQLLGPGAAGVRFYDDHPATLYAVIDLDRLQIKEVSISAEQAPESGGLYWFQASYSGFNDVSVEPPANARDYDAS